MQRNGEAEGREKTDERGMRTMKGRQKMTQKALNLATNQNKQGI